MSLTDTEAYGEILTMFKAAWDPRVAAYPDVDFAIPSGETVWARLSYDILTRRQSGFGDGQRKFERVGLLSFQIFTPLGGGSTDALNLAKVVADAFEGQSSPGGVWFRDLTGPSPAGVSGAFRQANMSVAFEYFEVK